MISAQRASPYFDIREGFGNQHNLQQSVFSFQRHRLFNDHLEHLLPEHGCFRLSSVACFVLIPKGLHSISVKETVLTVRNTTSLPKSSAMDCVLRTDVQISQHRYLEQGILPFDKDDGRSDLLVSTQDLPKQGSDWTIARKILDKLFGA